MKTRVCRVLALSLMICSVSAFVFAADQPDKARFVVIPPKPAAPGTPIPDVTLQTWNGSFTYNSHQYNYVMVGKDPSTGQGTIVTTWLIPVKIVLSDGPLGSAIRRTDRSDRPHRSVADVRQHHDLHPGWRQRRYHAVC